METVNHKLPTGVRLVCAETFWPEGRWKNYYKGGRGDSHFRTREEAMAAWARLD